MTELEQALKLLWQLADPGKCWFDHNHSCQEHGYFYLEQGDVCPVEQAKRMLRARGIDPDIEEWPGLGGDST